jgi:IclR family transcriptional regulator, acetate operon repressor
MKPVKADQPAARRGRKRTGAGVGAVRALTRGLDVLDTLARRREATLTEVAGETALAASTAYRILETLRSRGYASFSESTGRYRLGIRAFETGYAFVSQTHLKEAADPVMQRLAAETGESVNLAVLDGGEVVYIHQAEGRGMMRLFTRMGARAPVHCTGVGKCLLAWLPPEEMQTHLPPEPFARFTRYTITRKDAFLEVLAMVKRQGYALDDEEREEGVSCVTAPIRGPKGTVVAAISLSGPSTRIKRRGVTSLKALVRAAGREIGMALATQT